MAKTQSEPPSIPQAPTDDDAPELDLVDTDSSLLEEVTVQDTDTLENLWGGLPDDDEVSNSIAGITGRSPSNLPRNIGKAVSDLSGEDKYVVEEEIDRGGMGLVLRAFDHDVRRHVAMKVIGNKEDLEHRARFVEEAQVTGQLEHPNIVPIHELGIDAEGRLFFTMKLLRGKALSEILDEIREYPAVEAARYPLAELVHALTHACNAISFAHARGVVHRDLKPGNIWIGNYGEVYVMDWGLAKVGAAKRSSGRIEVKQPDTPPDRLPLPRAAQEAAEPAADVETVESHRHDSHMFITSDGTIAGTPAYMSPEQARGDMQAIDERSDVYALGAILYEILTLHAPVTGRSDKEFIEQVKRGRILSPHRRAPHRVIPEELTGIAMKALQYSPDQRYQTVDAMQAELSRFMNRLAVANAKEPLGVGLLRLCRQHQAKVFALAVALALLGGIVGGGIWTALRDRASNQQAAQTVQTTKHSPAPDAKNKDELNAPAPEPVDSTVRPKADATPPEMSAPTLSHPPSVDPDPQRPKTPLKQRLPAPP